LNWLLVLAAYLLGALPTSYIAGRRHNLDLRQHGSGNLGATNAFRVLGWRTAAPVMIIDIMKGWIPAALFPRLDPAAGVEWALVFGAAAIVGHVFSVFVQFRGGKGVATGAGVFMALAPWAVLMTFLVWGIILVLTRIVSAASLAAAVVLPFAVFATNAPRSVLWVSVALAAFVIYAHRSNIRRLLRGEERRFERKPENAT
jgi:acyl phosphate:glycerol-3-phosphate acyltransferase